MFQECLENVRTKAPLIHCITNYVTVNDVANVILACGGAPIMADDQEEAAEITSICGGLTINIGTLNTRTIRSMLSAGQKARELGHPILMEELHFQVIRGNVSELRALMLGSTTTRGVEAAAADAVTEQNLNDMVAMVKAWSKASGSIIAMTGAIDLVADAQRCFVIRNGRPEMGRITGTGCQLSGLMTAYITANPDRMLEASAAAVCLMGLAGETGWRHLAPYEGNATYRNRIIDAVCRIDGAELESGARYEIR